MSELKQAIKKLRLGESMGLHDFQNLSRQDLKALLEEVQHWCVYGNGDLEYFGKKHRED